MTIDELKGYRALDSEIQAIKRQVASLYNTYHSPSMTSDGASHQLSSQSPTEIALHKIDELKQLYSDKEIERLDNKIRIERWLETINDSAIRTSIRLHYHQGTSWKETTYIIYEDRARESTTKTAVYRFFRRKDVTNVTNVTNVPKHT